MVFRYTRALPIDFALFVRRVDIARTIQFMNDYLGGVVVALAHDTSGRPVRQAERNIYLPQPNYLVLYQGKPIDVSKLEVVEYEAGRHRLYWKTVLSENGSATYDDGIATFERTSDGTRVTITGRQQFALPTFWQVFDPDIVPGLKARLVTHAYQTFFDRTIANFEALVEGRDIRIGRPVDEPASPPVEQLMPTAAADRRDRDAASCSNSPASMTGQWPVPITASTQMALSTLLRHSPLHPMRSNGSPSSHGSSMASAKPYDVT